MKPSKSVDLSVMWANGSFLPQKIEVSECNPHNFYQPPGFVTGFYGFHARGKGMQYCVSEADAQNNKCVPVTLSVKLEKEISSRMVTPEMLKDVDFFNVARASRELIDMIAEFWYDRMSDRLKDDRHRSVVLRGINWKLTEQFMHKDESIVTDLLALPEFAHLRLFVYPAMPVKSSPIILAPISMGVTKKEFISSAVSPMFPNIEIAL